VLHCAESGKVTQTEPFRWHMWFQSGTPNLNTHTQCCSFIHWHSHYNIKFCFLPVNRNVAQQQNITVTQCSIVSIRQSFWGR